MQGQRFVKGTPVYDVDGEKLGTVREHREHDNALVVHHGQRHDDLYVPLGDIRATDANGIQLSVPKDDLVSYRWNNTPGGPTTTGRFTGETNTARQATPSGDITIPVREEELGVAKRQQERGGVGVHKNVTEEQQTVSAPVTHEEVQVERVPIDRPATNLPPDAWQDKDIDVPIRGEELVIEKRAKVSEEVHLKKRPVTKEQHVTGTVRKEQVRLDREGDVPIEGATDTEQTNTPAQR